MKLVAPKSREIQGQERVISEMTELSPESVLIRNEFMSTTEMHVQGGHRQV